MTLLEHLEELRTRLVWVALAVSVAGIAGWALFERTVDILLEPACPFLERTLDRCALITTGPMEAFSIRLKVAMYIGFGIAFPVVLYHFWRFISPGLHRQEKRYAVPFAASGMVLFAVGVGFAFYTLPQALTFLIGPVITGESVVPLLAAKNYLDFALLYLVVFGLAFEFPLVLMFLTLTRVVTSRQLGRYRRHVFMAIAVVTAFLTPSVDAYTMVVMTAAMYVLYEASIWLSRLLKR